MKERRRLLRRLPTIGDLEPLARALLANQKRGIIGRDGLWQRGSWPMGFSLVSVRFVQMEVSKGCRVIPLSICVK